MITKEPSQQVTPLSNEQAEFPAEIAPDGLTPPSAPPPNPFLPWLEAIKGFVVWFLSVIMLAVVPVLVALPYMIYQWVKFGPPRPEALMQDKTLIFLSILGVLPTHLLTLALVWLFVTEGGKRPFLEALSFHWPRSSSRLVTTLLCVLLALVLLGVGYAVTTLWGGSKTQLDLLVESSMAARVATALVAVITAPLVEEVIYRGALYSPIERVLGKGVAVLIVSLLFAGIHVLQYSQNIGVIVVITILSFTLTLSRAVTGSLIPPFLIHLVFNGIQAIFIVLTPFIEKYFPKGEEVTPTTPGLELAGRLFETIITYVWRMT
ncbi:MAG TPA: type II CAAX endopeptidase family protein [Pyrinomonadaceae bacterium]|nr:type II CAAX endopeptidase family protein [Pyrinomonadaceae bacterium]